MVGDGETNFPHKLLLTDRQVTSLCGNWYYVVKNSVI